MKNRIKSTFLLVVMLLVSIYVQSQTIIQMEKDGGVYKIPCEINGLRLKLIFDTGAANVCISESIALMMLENGYIDKTDIKGKSSSVVADGRIVDNTVINIKSLKLGGISLSDVEAVVIHQQSAPLLLGQSAIQKLGKVSIDGDRLILDRESNEYQISPIEQDATLGELFRAIDLANKANEAFDNESYELAAQFYSESYKFYNLGLNEKRCYAHSLRMLDKYNEALSIYKDIISDRNKEELEKKDNDFMVEVYFGMQVCYYKLSDFRTSIIIGQTALPKTSFDNSTRDNIVYFIAKSYDKMGDAYTCQKTFINEINNYLAYMDISATDCWDKGYKDLYIADLYYDLSLHSDDTVKYTIISAAWGSKDAIEVAKKLSLSYTQKPSRYEY